MQPGISGNAVLVVIKLFFSGVYNLAQKTAFFPPNFLKDQLGVLTTVTTVVFF